MTELEQLRYDLIYLAKRQLIIEDAVIRAEDCLVETAEWTSFITAELLKQGITIHKNKKSFVWFRSSLKETHRQTYEKFETLFKKIDILYKKRKGYDKYD